MARALFGIPDDYAELSKYQCPNQSLIRLNNLVPSESVAVDNLETLSLIYFGKCINISVS